MKQNFKSNQSGFVALMSAIIISALLIIITFSVSTTGFLSRFNVVDAENKNKSQDLAESCVDQKLLELANNIADTSTGSRTIGTDQCTVSSVSVTASQITVQTIASAGSATTKIKAVVTNPDFATVSWQETPN